MAKKKQTRLGEKLRESTRWDPLAQWTAVRVEILGEELITVENHKGILEYGETEMRINCGRRILRVTGMGLTLQAMTEEAIAICGRILGVEYLD